MRAQMLSDVLLPGDDQMRRVLELGKSIREMDVVVAGSHALHLRCAVVQKARDLTQRFGGRAESNFTESVRRIAIAGLGVSV